MPAIWLIYADFLASCDKITKTREVYDRALMSLPVTQHARIWKKYCEWVATTDAVKSACNVFDRYLKVNPDYKEEFVDYLVSKAQWDRAAVILVEVKSILIDRSLMMMDSSPQVVNPIMTSSHICVT
jgi:pre-mRNA-splicing factor SYF1